MEVAIGSDSGDNTRGSTDGTDFGFGFDDPKFSNRILRVEVLTGPPEPKLGEAGEPNHPLPQHIEGSSSNSTSSRRVTTVHINSLILASKSPFFHKMFSNGIKESEQQAVTLSVHASEELSLFDLLQFLCNDELRAKTPSDLLNVLLLADRCQIVSCVRYCVRKLKALPMTLELALLFVDLPSSVLADDGVLQLVDAARTFLSEFVEKITLHQEEALKLPLHIIEGVLSGDNLQVGSEDEVYDFVVKWARAHYEDPSERHQVFCSRLCRLIRFPYMSYEKLKTVLQCSELDQGDATKMVVDTLFYKAQKLHPPSAVTRSPCLERTYKYRPVKVTVLDSPYRECIIYFDLKKEECEKLGEIRTQKFHFGDHCFYFRLCKELNRPPTDKVAVYLHQDERRYTKVVSEVAVRSRTTGKYVDKKTDSCVFMHDCKCLLHHNLLDESWDSFMSEHSEYFINGVFHVRFTVRILR